MISWWEHSLGAYTAAQYPPPPDAHVDAVVVGAGLVGIGAATALRQQRPQWRVALLEAAPRLANASSRNAGFACFGTAGELLDELRHSTPSAVRARLEQRYRGLQHLRQRLGEAAIGYEPCGGYEIFFEQESFDRACAFLPTLNGWMAALGCSADVYVPTTVNGQRAIYNPLEGALDTGRMLQAALDRALAAGVSLHFGSEVVQWDETGVRLASGATLRAAHVLLATNAHASALADSSVLPGRGYVFVTDPLPDAAFPWRGTFHYHAGYVYFRHIDSPEGRRLLLGGARHIALAEEQTLAPEVNPTIRSYLIDFAQQRLGLPAPIGIAHEWAGIMGFGPGGAPELRALAHGRWLAAGLGGMGVAWGLQFGEAAAAQLLAASPHR